MRQAECDYWDGICEAVTEGEAIYDNWLKRQTLAQLLLKCQWGRQKVLEIGVGNGVTAAMLGLSCGRMWDYTGTDLSPKFVESTKKRFALNIVQGDVLSLPSGSFTRILALDSLEHVRPEDRPQGYREISERLSRHGLMFINMPLNESGHKDEFDHGIGLEDLVEMERAGLSLGKYEQYQIKYPQGTREYAFVVMTK